MRAWRLKNYQEWLCKISDLFEWINKPFSGGLLDEVFIGLRIEAVAQFLAHPAEQVVLNPNPPCTSKPQIFSNN